MLLLKQILLTRQLLIKRIITLIIISVSSENAEPIVYTVKAGDNLWNISLKYGVSVEAIIEVNNLRDKDLLSLGQKLEIPAIGGGVSNSNQKQEPTIVTYTVVKGDTLWSISQRYDVKMSSIIPLII